MTICLVQKLFSRYSAGRIKVVGCFFKYSVIMMPAAIKLYVSTYDTLIMTQHTLFRITHNMYP